MSVKKLENIIAGGIGVIAFILYYLTSAPAVNFIDSGELATVASTLGIAHPTGYPFFTLVGHLFSLLPIGLRVIQRLNLMSAFFCAAGLFFYFKFLTVLFKSLVSPVAPKDKLISADLSAHLYQVIIPSGVGTVILAFSETYWSQGLSVEVYSIHIFFLSVLLYLFSLAGSDDGSLEIRNKVKYFHLRRWFIFAFILGLSFTNHMTTILLLPGFIFLFFNSFGINRFSLRNGFKMLVPFAVGYSVYLYLPLRSGQMPLMNWGNPVDLEKFFWHFSGKVYRVWIFSSTDSAVKQFTYFINGLPAEFVFLPLFLAAVGVMTLLRRHKSLFIYTLVLFVSCLLYSINYDIHDIDSYFLLSYFMVAAWSAIGIFRLIQWSRKSRNAIIAALLSFCALMVAYNYHRVDESDNYLVEDYTYDMFKSLEPDGIVISYQWDYFISAAYYHQLVENYRKDVIIIDKELLRRSWYYNQLKTRFPSMIAKSQKEIDEFLSELSKFENDRPYQPAVIESKYAAVIQSLIQKNYTTRPVYVTSEIEEQYTRGFRRVPNGLAFRLYADDLLYPHQEVNFKFNIPSRLTVYTDGLLSMYARAYLNNGVYENHLRNYSLRDSLIMKAFRLKPELQNDPNIIKVLKNR